MLYIHGATLYTPDTVRQDAALLIEGEKILAVGDAADLICPDGAEAVDASGLLLVPGFIDLQINGGFGHDFTADPAGIWSVARQLPQYGVTGFLPTIITSPLATIAQGQAILQAGPPRGFRGATPLGLHVEGPFLNPQKKGAHNPRYLAAPDVEAVQGWSPQTGVRLVTLAPELTSSLGVTRSLASRGIVVSAGHSMATYDEAMAGFDAGIRYGTHLFNAMPPLSHRDPGLAGALLTDERVTVGLIADGIHTHPAVIRLVRQALRSRLSLVTDAMAALGMPFGRHRLADFDVTVDETGARLADGTLAGSVLSLDQALRNLTQWAAGCPLGEALASVTTTPADLLGDGDQRGRIAPGLLADLVLLTPDLQVRMTFAAGVRVYDRGK